MEGLLLTMALPAEPSEKAQSVTCQETRGVQSWGCGSVGRVLASQAGSPGFDLSPHKWDLVVQACNLSTAGGGVEAGESSSESSSAT